MSDMASWLSSQDRTRGRHSQDIRKYIRVHGKVVKPPSQGPSAFEIDRDSDDFSTQSTSSFARRAKPTKQLTLNYFKKKLSEEANGAQKSEGSRKGTNDVASGKNELLFLPALRFSTGVRRKVKREDMENTAAPETKSKTSPLRGVQHKAIKRKAGDGRPIPLSPVQPQTNSRNCQQKEEEVVIKSSGSFLSSRKKTKTGEAMSQTTDSRTHTETASSPEHWMKPGVEGVIAFDTDPDLYINTDELLDELSNCEKSLLNVTHTS